MWQEGNDSDNYNPQRDDKSEVAASIRSSENFWQDLDSKKKTNRELTKAARKKAERTKARETEVKKVFTDKKKVDNFKLSRQYEAKIDEM